MEKKGGGDREARGFETFGGKIKRKGQPIKPEKGNDPTGQSNRGVGNKRLADSNPSVAGRRIFTKSEREGKGPNIKKKPEIINVKDHKVGGGGGKGK